MMRNHIRKSKARLALTKRIKRKTELEACRRFNDAYNEGWSRGQAELTRYLKPILNGGRKPLYLNARPDMPRMVVPLPLPLHLRATAEEREEIPVRMPTAEFIVEEYVEEFYGQQVRWYGWRLERWGPRW